MFPCTLFCYTLGRCCMFHTQCPTPTVVIKLLDCSWPFHHFVFIRVLSPPFNILYKYFSFISHFEISCTYLFHTIKQSCAISTVMVGCKDLHQAMSLAVAVNYDRLLFVCHLILSSYLYRCLPLACLS